MRPLDFYKLGMHLARTASVDAEYRTVINRVYYGLHHETCCRYLRFLPTPQPLNSNQRHTELRNRLNDPGNPPSGEVSQLLGSLMRMRTEADYQLNPPLRHRNRSYSSEQLMVEAVRLGEDLLEALERYSPGEAPDGCNCPTVFSSR